MKKKHPLLEIYSLKNHAKNHTDHTFDQLASQSIENQTINIPFNSFIHQQTQPIQFDNSPSKQQDSNHTLEIDSSNNASQHKNRRLKMTIQKINNIPNSIPNKQYMISMMHKRKRPFFGDRKSPRKTENSYERYSLINTSVSKEVANQQQLIKKIRESKIIDRQQNKPTAKNRFNITESLINAKKTGKNIQIINFIDLQKRHSHTLSFHRNREYRNTLEHKLIQPCSIQPAVINRRHEALQQRKQKIKMSNGSVKLMKINSRHKHRNCQQSIEPWGYQEMKDMGMQCF